MSDELIIGQVWEWEAGGETWRLEVCCFSGDAVYYRYWKATPAMSTSARVLVQLRIDGARLIAPDNG